EQSKKLTVEDDPRITLTAEERTARRAALDQLARLAGNASTATRNVVAIRTSLNNYIEGYKRPNGNKPPENIQRAAEELLKRVDDSCKKLATAQQCGERAATLGNAGPALTYTPPPVTQRLAQLLGGMEGYTAAPTAYQLEQVKLLSSMFAEATGSAAKLGEDLKGLNK